MDISIKIIEINYVEPFILNLKFSDGHVSKVNFEQFLKTSQLPDVKKYVSTKAFRKYRLKNGSLMWGDFEMIFPIEDLYYNKIEHFKN